SQAALRCSLRIKTSTEHLEDYLYKELLLATKGVEKFPYDDCTILESSLVTDTIASLPPGELESSAAHIGDLERAARDRGKGEEADYWHCVLALVKEQLAAKTEAGPKLAPTSGLGIEDNSVETLLGVIESAEVLRGVEDELKWLLTNKDSGGPADEVDEEFITAALEKVPHYISRLRVDDIHRRARKVVEKVVQSMDNDEVEVVEDAAKSSSAAAAPAATLEDTPAPSVTSESGSVEGRTSRRRAVSPVPIERGTSALEPITEEASRSEMAEMRRKIVEQWDRKDRSAKAEVMLMGRGGTMCRRGTGGRDTSDVDMVIP
ncbi:hypothetical protein FOZ63_006149, partial [Perkinsus olseni]